MGGGGGVVAPVLSKVHRVLEPEVVARMASGGRAGMEELEGLKCGLL